MGDGGVPCIDNARGGVTVYELDERTCTPSCIRTSSSEMDSECLYNAIKNSGIQLRSPVL
jgi:hypothetical protein